MIRITAYKSPTTFTSDTAFLVMMGVTGMLDILCTIAAGNFSVTGHRFEGSRPCHLHAT